MKNVQRLLTMIFTLAALNACVTQKSVFLQPGPSVNDETYDFSLPDPKNKIVVIFNNGTASSNALTKCSANKAPEIWKSLAGTVVGDKDIYVYYLCTSATGDSYIYGRAKEIEEALDKFAVKGVPTNQIFLAGQSAGAWSSMVVARNASHKFNSIIGTAPAFAGYWARRSSKWQSYHDSEVAQIKKMPNLNAMIYAFEGDIYNKVKDLEFLKDIPGVTFIRMSGVIVNGVTCSRPNPHSTSRRSCFLTEKGRILKYIQDQVAKSIHVAKS